MATLNVRGIFFMSVDRVAGKTLSRPHLMEQVKVQKRANQISKGDVV